MCRAGGPQDWNWEPLLYSTRDTTLHLSDATVSKSSNPHKELKIAWLHQQMHFISLLHLFTLSARIRVGFGVDDISNTIEH